MFFGLPVRSRLATACACLSLLASVVGSAAQTTSETPVVPASPEPVELSFDFTQGVVLLDVDYGGTRPAKVMFDTGDADSLLDLNAARAIGLPLDMKDLKAAGSGEGAVTFYQTDPPRARLGAAEFSGKGLIVMPVAANLLADAGVRCEGTLGYGFFKDRVVQIDYPARKLRLYPAAPKGDPRTAAEGADLPIQWRQAREDGPPLVTTDGLHLGDHTVTAQIDTCFSHALLLYATKLPWLEAAPRSDQDPVMYEGTALQPVWLTMRVALGNLSFQVNPAAYLTRDNTRVPDTDISAVLGNRFFENGVLTLDFRTNRFSAEWKRTPAQ